MARKRLKGSLFGKRVYHFFKTDSTNRVAMELGYADEPEGAVVLAEEQTAGRGRAGRSWHSERGAGLYVTLLLRPKLSPVQAPLLTMLADCRRIRRCWRRRVVGGIEVAERFVAEREEIGRDSDGDARGAERGAVCDCGDRD